jgi:hypothetical protein
MSNLNDDDKPPFPQMPWGGTEKEKKLRANIALGGVALCVAAIFAISCSETVRNALERKDAPANPPAAPAENTRTAPQP